MNYWHQKGADKKKLIMGMPMYGQTFTLNSPSPSGNKQIMNISIQFPSRKIKLLMIFKVLRSLQEKDWRANLQDRLDSLPTTRWIFCLP